MRSVFLVCCVWLVQGESRWTCGTDDTDWPIVVFDMDVARHRPATSGGKNQPIGTIDVVPGRFSDACRFSFLENALGGFFTASANATSQWDQAAGISFWVKGDGSANWGGLELIDAADYKLRYGYCFPLDSTEWRKITVPWCDLIPELPAGMPVCPQQGYLPSRFGNLWFGKWFYWGNYPTHSFAIDETPGKQGEVGSEASQERMTGGELKPAVRPSQRHPVPRQHPRLLGSLDRLQRLAQKRSSAYQRVIRVAKQAQGDAHSRMISMALVSAIEQDESLARQAIEMALEYVDGPIKSGHVPFGHDLARCAIVYDLCHQHWTSDEIKRFHAFMNNTVDANIHSEPHVFHNGWYGYKNWGIGLAAYACYYENPRAKAIIRSLESEFRMRAAPALELAGNGGGWAEGYYVNYWLYEWLFFCEVARWCEGVDYYAMAPAFFHNRAVAGMFETYPGVGIYNTRRPIPMGDGGGRVFGGDRDKSLAARRILVNHFPDDPNHQAVQAFNETTPRCGVGNYAYKDFLWRDAGIKQADLQRFRLSHFSPGPGYVHARSSWDEDATYFFFKCGDRFTAHQHLDVGHFLIFKHAELVGDGGHYDAFGTTHDVNYHLRSIAHNTILVHDPSETWPDIRARKVQGNDGGQAHDWPHHNGAVADADAWNEDRALYDIADIVAFNDFETHVYVAGDGTRAYSAKKLELFTRQIVFERPGTFVIFDRVVSVQADLKKTWLLQAMKRPADALTGPVITNGEGRLFVETLLPRKAQVKIRSGEDLYAYAGNTYPAARNTGPAPECRIEVSPERPARVDYFLHVLTATDSTVESIRPAVLEESERHVRVRLPETVVSFDKKTLAGSIEAGNRRISLE